MAVTASLSFALRGQEGLVSVTYSVNDDPSRWGYDLLGVDFDPEIARGFPVTQARATFPREGYAGMLGWVQAVDYVVTHDGVAEGKVWVVPDVVPQAIEVNTPYMSFGIDPVMFDAPAFTEANVDWTARTFLTYTPDCLMTRAVEPLCGFRWGYEIAERTVKLKQLFPCTREDWYEAQRMLRVRLPTWAFGGDGWEPPLFNE